MDKQEVGNRIKELRERRGIKQNALATLAGVSPTYIYQLEKGEKSPSVEYLSHICWGLGITLEEFFKKENGCKPTEYDSLARLTEEQKAYLNCFLNSLNNK